MLLKNALYVFSTFILLNSAFANEIELCAVSSDIDSDVGKIVYQLDQDQRVIEHLYQDNYHNGVKTERIELKADGLKEGIVLSKKDKYIIVRMHSDNFDQAQGGVLYLDTLYNGVNGERREYEMDLNFNKEALELTQNKVPFNKMKFIAKRSKILGVIGVERVEFKK